jgi:hypothetical protein
MTISGCPSSCQNSQAISLFASRDADRTPYAGRIHLGGSKVAKCGLIRATASAGRTNKIREENDEQLA